MKPQTATAVLAVSLLVGDYIALKHSDSLVPREHIHLEVRTEPIPTTSTYFAASGGQVVFDNEASSPEMPWVSWLPDFKFPEHLVSKAAQLAMMGVVYQSLRDE
jgi:hypothetical protein